MLVSRYFPINYYFRPVHHIQKVRLREEILYFLLNPLRARAEILDIPAVAFRADGRHRLFLSAVMAAQRVFRAVIGHGDIALGAGNRIAAAAAGNVKLVLL